MLHFVPIPPLGLGSNVVRTRAEQVTQYEPADVCLFFSKVGMRPVIYRFSKTKKLSGCSEGHRAADASKSEYYGTIGHDLSHAVVLKFNTRSSKTTGQKYALFNKPQNQPLRKASF